MTAFVTGAPPDFPRMGICNVAIVGCVVRADELGWWRGFGEMVQPSDRTVRLDCLCEGMPGESVVCSLE